MYYLLNIDLLLSDIQNSRLLNEFLLLPLILPFKNR